MEKEAPREFQIFFSSKIRGLLVLHLVVEDVAALPGEDGEAAVEDVDEVVGLERDLEAEALPDDDVPRRAELLVQLPLDLLGNFPRFPRKPLASDQNRVQRVLLENANAKTFYEIRDKE